MSKAKVKVTVKKGKSGTLLARMPLSVTQNDSQSGKPLYQTRAQLNVHINRGARPKKSRLRGTN